MVSVYSTIQSIFTVLQEENKKNIVYTEKYNIPVSNNYYSFIIDPNDNDYKLALTNIYRTDFIDSREPGIVISTGLIEEEQIYDINIINKNIKEVGVLITNILQSVNESSSTLHLIIDIDFLLTLFKKFYDKGCEIHVIDFIIYKFKNKVDAIYIYSKDSMLNTKSVLYKEIMDILDANDDADDIANTANTANDDANTDANNDANNDANTDANDDANTDANDDAIANTVNNILMNKNLTLYKNINNTYWYLDIKDDDEDSDTPNISIDIDISNISSNIFNENESLYVLNPYDKNKLFL